MPARLEEILREAQRFGLLGPESLQAGIEHARGFAKGLPSTPMRLLDLGSGGGLPGLPLAQVWVDSFVVLLDASRRRTEFLEWAVKELGWAPRVTVLRARAETAARQAGLRARFDTTVARGFGRPAVTAECAAGFLQVGGWLVVSEPPNEEKPTVGGSDEDRWPADGVRTLGMGLGPMWTAPYRYRALVQVAACPSVYPRRVGVPAKRPLF
jgi:16S rRNA (guanine527-N7)-methyltransferase